MALHDRSIPPTSLREPLTLAIGALPDDRLLTYLRVGPLSPRGFRLEPRSLPRLRQWLLQRLMGPLETPEEFLLMLAQHVPLCRTLALFTPETLRENRDAMASVIPAGALETALRLDPRTAVRELAALPPCAEAPFDPQPARERLAERLAPLMSALENDAHGASTPDTHDATNPEWRRKLQTEQRRRRAAERHLETARQELETRRQESDDRNRALRECRDRAESLQARLSEQQAEIETAVQTFAARLDDAVARRIQDKAHAWLSPLESLQQTADTATEAGKTLEQQVEQALRHQAKTDRHWGNRATLASLRKRLQDVRLQALDAQTQALHPLPEWSSLIPALDRTLADIDQRLGLDTAPSDDTITRIAAHLNSLPETKLTDGVALLTQLSEAELLDPRHANGLQRLLALRRQRFQAARMPEIPKDLRADQPVDALRMALNGAIGLTLMVDAHNCLFSLRGRYDADFEAGVPRVRARDHMIRDFRALVADHPSLEARLVFDGPERSDQRILPNLLVTYSGGSGTDRADRVLTENIDALRREPGIRLLVVSNDQSVRFRARGRGAMTISPGELEPFMSAAGARVAAPRLYGPANTPGSHPAAPD